MCCPAGVDLMLDVHGDEALPYTFAVANEGIPGYTPRLKKLEVGGCLAASL